MNLRTVYIPLSLNLISYTPEITLKNLEARGGRGYLDLVSSIQPHPSEDQYTYIPHSLVDSKLGIKSPFRTHNEYPADTVLFVQQGQVHRAPNAVDIPLNSLGLGSC